MRLLGLLLPALVQPEQTPASCFVDGYTLVPAANTPLTNVNDAAACQQECHKLAACSFFTYLPSLRECFLGASHDGGEASIQLHRQKGAVAGPRICENVPAACRLKLQAQSESGSRREHRPTRNSRQMSAQNVRKRGTLPPQLLCWPPILSNEQSSRHEDHRTLLGSKSDVAAASGGIGIHIIGINRGEAADDGMSWWWWAILVAASFVCLGAAVAGNWEKNARKSCSPEKRRDIHSFELESALDDEEEADADDGEVQELVRSPRSSTKSRTPHCFSVTEELKTLKGASWLPMTSGLRPPPGLWVPSLGLGLNFERFPVGFERLPSDVPPLSPQARLEVFLR